MLYHLQNVCCHILLWAWEAQLLATEKADTFCTASFERLKKLILDNNNSKQQQFLLSNARTALRWVLLGLGWGNLQAHIIIRQLTYGLDEEAHNGSLRGDQGGMWTVVFLSLFGLSLSHRTIILNCNFYAASLFLVSVYLIFSISFCCQNPSIFSFLSQIID